MKVDFMRFKKSSVQRSFDITVVTKKDQIQFSGIDRNEFDELVNYFKNKNVKIGSEDGDENIEVHQMVVLNINNFYEIIRINE